MSPFDDFIRADGPDDLAELQIRPDRRLTISRTGSETVAEVWTAGTGTEVTIAAFSNVEYAMMALPVLVNLALQLID